MDERRKQTWIDLVTLFLGEECVAYIRAHPVNPEVEIESGAVVLNEVISEEEKFLYLLLPSEQHSQKILASSLPAISVLWNLWWTFVAINHRIFGDIAIRKGWVLVQPKSISPLNVLYDFIKEMERCQKQVMVGEFEFKKPGEKDFLS